MKNLIKIKYDDSEARLFLVNLTRSVSDIREPLERVGGVMVSEALSNFPAKGRIFGEKWPPYAKPGIRRYVDKEGKIHTYWFPGTEEIKRRLGYGGQPMMVRTGRLRGNFHSIIGNDFVEIYNPTPYAIYHQEGRMVYNLPRRVLLKITSRQINKVIQVFDDWVGKLIKKYVYNLCKNKRFDKRYIWRFIQGVLDR